MTVNSSKLICALVATLGIGLLSSRAQAQNTTLEISLAAPVQSGTIGSTIFYDATFVNTGVSTLFLNSISFDFSGIPLDTLTADDAPFFTNFPLSLNAGDTFTGTLFGINILPTAAPGSYSPTVLISGGATSVELSPLGGPGKESVPFTVNATAVAAPEPGALVLLALGGAVALRRRRG